MTKTALVLLGPLEDRQKAILEAAAPGWTFVYRSRREAAPDEWAAAEVILGSPLGDRKTLSDLKNLKWVQLSSAGADQYTAPGILPQGCILTCSTGVFGEVIGDYMLAATLLLLQNFQLYRDNQLAGIWHREAQPKSLGDCVVLILGAGDIGGAYARRVKALGAAAIGVRRSPGEKPDFLDELHLTADLDTLLPRADVVAMALPDTPETRGIMDGRRLGLMKREAILLNVGRGSAVDTEALCDALDGGVIAGAALDVTNPEPLPAGHRLWGCKNAFITPHISGEAAGLEPKVELFAHNLAAYVQGTPMESVVDLRTGYRAGR